MGQFALGQSVPRTEDPRLLTGRGRYTDDFTLPRQAHGYVLRSPHAHARIKSIDVRAAQADAGRAGGADRRGLGGGKFRHDAAGDAAQAPRRLADVSAAPAARSRTIACCYVGDPVAFVVAESVDRGARTPPSCIAIDYEPLPAVITARRGARAERAQALVRLRRITNASSTDRRQGGGRCRFRPRRITCRSCKWCSTASPRTPWSRAAASAITTPARAQHALCRHAAAASDARRSGGARCSKPGRQFRVVAGDVGGGFGMKGWHYPGIPARRLWRRETCRPPGQMDLRAQRGLLSDEHARDNITEAELALDKDGKFLGAAASRRLAMSAPIMSSRAQ